MTAIWTSPKSWTFKEILDSAKLNTQLRDNMDYLFKRPMDYVIYPLTGAWGTTLGVWTELPNPHVFVPTETGRIRLDFQATSGGSATTFSGAFDIYNITEGYYLSSRTGTPRTYGLFDNTSSNAAYSYGNSFYGIDYDLTVGMTYEYAVFMKSQYTSPTQLGVDDFIQLFGREF